MNINRQPTSGPPHSDPPFNWWLCIHYTWRISLSQSRSRIRFELKSINNLFGYRTNSNGSVRRLCSICSIIELTKISVFDFVRFDGISSIDFSKADTSDCKVSNCSLVLRQTLTRFRISRAEFQISMIRISFCEDKISRIWLKNW